MLGKKPQNEIKIKIWFLVTTVKIDETIWSLRKVQKRWTSESWWIFSLRVKKSCGRNERWRRSSIDVRCVSHADWITHCAFFKLRHCVTDQRAVCSLWEALKVEFSQFRHFLSSILLTTLTCPIDCNICHDSRHYSKKENFEEREKLTSWENRMLATLFYWKGKC